MSLHKHTNPTATLVTNGRNIPRGWVNDVQVAAGVNQKEGQCLTAPCFSSAQVLVVCYIHDFYVNLL